MTSAWKHWVFKASPVHMGRSTLDKPGVTLRPESRSSTSGFIIETNQPWLSKHSMNLYWQTQFQNTSILAKKSGHMECIIREVIKIELHSNNMNSEDFSLSKSLKPLLQTLKEWERAISKEKWLAPHWFNHPRLNPFWGHPLHYYCESNFYNLPNWFPYYLHLLSMQWLNQYTTLPFTHC